MGPSHGLSIDQGRNQPVQSLRDSGSKSIKSILKKKDRSAKGSDDSGSRQRPLSPDQVAVRMGNTSRERVKKQLEQFHLSQKGSQSPTEMRTSLHRINDRFVQHDRHEVEPSLRTNQTVSVKQNLKIQEGNSTQGMPLR